MKQVLIILFAVAAAGIFAARRAPLPDPKVLRDLSTNERIAFVQDMAAKEGPEETYKFIKSAFITPLGIAENVHYLVHIIGASLYAAYGPDGIDRCDGTLTFACYHGFITAMIAEEGLGVMPKLVEACYRTRPENYGCIHGVGHAALFMEGYNLERGLKHCDLVPEGTHRERCWDGALMEYGFHAPVSHFPADDPWYPCSRLPEKYDHICARGQIRFVHKRFQRDIPEVAAICSQAKNPALRTTCLSAVGEEISASSNGDPAMIQAQCGLLPDEESRNTCIIQAARTTVFYQFYEWRRNSRLLCEALKSDRKESCQDGVENMSKLIEEMRQEGFVDYL